MNNYCRNCGERLTNPNVCEKCNTKVLTNRVGELDRALAKKYIKIFFAMIILYFMSYIIMFMFELLNSSILYSLISPIIGLIISYFPLILIIFIIYAKKKLKYSKFFNIVFWIMVLMIVLFILFMLLALISYRYTF